MTLLAQHQPPDWQLPQLLLDIADIPQLRPHQKTRLAIRTHHQENLSASELCTWHARIAEMQPPTLVLAMTLDLRKNVHQ
jgi:hypothetical protein